MLPGSKIIRIIRILTQEAQTAPGFDTSTISTSPYIPAHNQNLGSTNMTWQQQQDKEKKLRLAKIDSVTFLETLINFNET